MKIHGFGTKFNFALVALALSGWAASAQMPGAGPAGMSAALTKLFGDIKAFTANAEVQALDGEQKELASMPMDFAMLDKKIRVEIDLLQVKSRNMPPGATATLKQMGLAHVVSIIRPDTKMLYVFYPEAQASLVTPLSNEGDSKVTKAPQGKEKLDGHPCVKNKVTIKDEKGETVEATTWNATDLKDFPLQIQTKEKENTSFVRFKQVKLEKPDAKLFEVPPGYTQYSNQQDLVQGVMRKVMGGPGAPAPGK